MQKICLHISSDVDVCISASQIKNEYAWMEDKNRSVGGDELFANELLIYIYVPTGAFFSFPSFFAGRRSSVVTAAHWQVLHTYKSYTKW